MQFANGSTTGIREVLVSEANILAQVELFLRNLKSIDNNEDIISIEMGPNENGLRKIKIKYRKELEVRSLSNGKG